MINKKEIRRTVLMDKHTSEELEKLSELSGTDKSKYIRDLIRLGLVLKHGKIVEGK